MIAERLGLLVAAALVAIAMVAATVADGAPAPTGVDPTRPLGVVDAAPTPTPTTSPTPSPPPGEPASWVVLGPEGAALRDGAAGAVDEVAAPGLAWPVLEEVDGGYRVATHCARDGWVAAEDVRRPVVARGEGLAGAVIVLDAGHGGIDAGAGGPDGLLEREVNLEVAERLQALLERGNDIDDSGAVSPGGTHPPVAAVVMTRDRDDAKTGDQRTALSFRGRLASAVDADALLSIHHNAGDRTTFDEPATEVYYSVDDDASPRLAALVLEELRRSLGPFAQTWRGQTDAGTLGRRDPDGTDYYTVLEESGDVPAVITEAVYLSDPAAEDLAATEEFQEAYAEGLYRALVRFLTTDDPGDGVNDPYEYSPGDADPYDYDTCSLAVQPDGDTDEVDQG